MSRALAYFNGQWLPETEIRLALDDAGFVMGATVTDRCRTFRHCLYRLSEHIERFRRGCLGAAIPQPVPDHELTRVAERLVHHNAALLDSRADLSLVMCATPGPMGHRSGGSAEPPTLLMHTMPLDFARYAPFFEQGATLLTPSVRQPPRSTMDPRIKHRSRLHWWLAEQEVHALDPSASALLLDETGHVTETASANFAIVKDGTIITAPSDMVLSGISMQTVREFCDELAIPFHEDAFTMEDCLSCDEAFLTCTSYCLAGASAINGNPLPWPGAVTLRLLDQWNRIAGLDIRLQIVSRGSTSKERS